MYPLYCLTGRAGIYSSQAKESKLGFKLDNILWCLMEVKVHVGFLFPSHTLVLRMNQLNKLLKLRQCRQSTHCTDIISCLLTAQPRAQPAAGSSRLGFTGLLLGACSYSNLTQPSLCHPAAEPVPIASASPWQPRKGGNVLVLSLGRGRCAELSCGCCCC